MSVTRLINELQLLGVQLTPDDDHLQVEAPSGSLTEEMRAALVEHKAEILANRKRFKLVKTQVADAIRKYDQASPGKYEWERDTISVRDASTTLDEAMANYVEGTGTMEQVREAFIHFLQMLEVQYEEPADKPQLVLVK